MTTHCTKRTSGLRAPNSLLMVVSPTASSILVDIDERDIELLRVVARSITSPRPSCREARPNASPRQEPWRAAKAHHQRISYSYFQIHLGCSYAAKYPLPRDDGIRFTSCWVIFAALIQRVASPVLAEALDRLAR